MKELKCSQGPVNGANAHRTVWRKKAFNLNEIGAYFAFFRVYSKGMPMKSVDSLISVADTTPL
jgi:hypothetical protein